MMTTDLVWAAREALRGMKEADRIADEEDEHPDRDDPGKSMTPMQRIRFHLLSNMMALETALAAVTPPSGETNFTIVSKGSEATTTKGRE